MAENQGSKAGIWRVGILLEASFLAQLRNSPMKLITPVTAAVPVEENSSSHGVVALCKQGLFNTYQFANEYITPNQVGCQLHAADHKACSFPSVLAASLSDKRVDFDEVFQQLNIQLQDVYVVTGFPQPSEPTIILASQHFMECYGFFTHEPVWFRWFSPTALDKVMLAPVGPLASRVMVNASQVTSQLYFKAEQESVIVQQGFKFIFRTDDSTPASGLQNTVLTFHVLECGPVLQGRITKDTVLTFLPSLNVVSHDHHLSRRRRSTREEGKSHAESAASALDLEFLNEEGMSTEGYVIEVVSVASFKLQSQYIVLPKETAIKHGIFHCQNVLIEAAEEVNKRSHISSLSEVTVRLFIDNEDNKPSGKRAHMAIAFLYEDEFELEHYISPPSLGMDYDTATLTLAYIHPQLLFFLFPETLSRSVHYYLHIKRAKTTLPAVKMLQVAEVASPNSRSQEPQATGQLDLTHPVLGFFEQRSVLLNVGEIFKVSLATGNSCYYKVCSLEPNSNGAATVDANPSWACVMKPRKTHSFVSDIVPPSTVAPEPHFFHSIFPAGLSQYTNTLFSFFIPAFRASSCTQPHRCPSVLLTGPPGVGKRTIIKAVARRCRMNVIEFNCYEFTSDVVPFAEKKLTSELDQATSYDPVVIILSNVHMMGRKNISQEEPRISALFEHYMVEVNKFNGVNNFPVIVIGVTSKLEDVPGRVLSCFLHQLEVSPPTQPQRQDMLKSLSRQYHLGLDVDLAALSQSTPGYVLGDLLKLLMQAFDLAVETTHSYCTKEMPYESEDIGISGVVLKQVHLDQALAKLHASHSDSIGAPKIPSVNWDDVGGLAEAKKEILDTIQIPLVYPDLFGCGLRRSGVLLYGAPGTGKTLLAKAVATECSLNFLSVKGPELITMYVGQSEENIREVFSRARSCSPSVIFFDELDSIAPNRGRSGDSGGVMDRVVSQLLAELDGLHKAKDVFIIGATNRPDLIDPALLRPGRFDRLVYLGVNNDQAAKEKILRAITRKFQLAPDVDLTSIAKNCPANLTGADLYSLCSDATLIALRRQIDMLEANKSVDEDWDRKLEVEQRDFVSALHSLTPSITPQELEKYKNINTKITT